MIIGARHHRFAAVGLASLATAAILSLSACGNIAEKAAEEVAEQAIESESGDEVDLDIDENGDVSIETEDGSLKIEDGELVVDDGNGGTVVAQVDNDDDGITIEGEDGSVFQAGETSELPEDWPSDLPKPNGLSITASSSMAAGDERFVSVTGTAEDPAAWIGSFAESLESAGFTQDSAFESDGMTSRSLSKDTLHAIVTSDASGQITLVITGAAQPG